jgi:hypothetical protein
LAPPYDLFHPGSSATRVQRYRFSNQIGFGQLATSRRQLKQGLYALAKYADESIKGLKADIFDEKKLV